MLTFPLALADFADDLRLTTLSFDLRGGMQANQDGGGGWHRAGFAEPLWIGEAEIAPNTHAGARQVTAIMRALSTRADASFLIGDWTRRFLADDPTGTITTSATATVAEINADNKRVKLAGVPPGVTLYGGDHLSWTYGGSPMRYALHEVVDGARANAQGATDWIEVVPFIRSGVTVGASVQVQYPACKAIVVPGSFQAGTHQPVITDGFSFQFVQTFR